MPIREKLQALVRPILWRPHGWDISLRYDFRLSQLLRLICLIARLKHDKRFSPSLWNYWLNIFPSYFLFLFFFLALVIWKIFVGRKFALFFRGMRVKVFWTNVVRCINVFATSLLKFNFKDEILDLNLISS